jgi:CBS domain-containing protein
VKARDLMTTNPACCTPADPVERVAGLMREHDCGCIPVVSDADSRHLLGVVTDRDIAVRGVARGGSGSTPVSEVMSTQVSCCGPETALEDVERIMAERQVRRVPVVDEDGCCIGMIAQADLAREAEWGGLPESEVGRVVERISRPLNDPRAEKASGSEGDRIR